MSDRNVRPRLNDDDDNTPAARERRLAAKHARSYRLLAGEGDDWFESGVRDLHPSEGLPGLGLEGEGGVERRGVAGRARPAWGRDLRHLGA